MSSLLVNTCLKQSLPFRIKLTVRSTGHNSPNLRSEVVSLYKNLIYLSRDWHTDLRPQIKNAFMKNRDVKDPGDIRELLDKGDYICRELIATYNLKKYRAMKRRYYTDDDENKRLQELSDSYKS